MVYQKPTDVKKGDSVQLSDGTKGTVKGAKSGGDGLHVEVHTPTGLVSVFFQNLTRLIK